MKVLDPAAVVREMNVRETGAEGVQERPGAVPLGEAQTKVRVADVEMKTGLGNGVEDGGEILGAGEQPVEVLDHERYASLGGVLGELRDRLGVPFADLVDRMKRDLGIGMDVDELGPRVRKRLERPPVEIVCRLAKLVEGGRYRQIPRRVADYPEPEIAGQSSDLFPVDRPRGGRLDREIDEVEAVLVDAMDLLQHGTAGKVHSADEHGSILTCRYARLVETYEAIMTRRSVPKLSDRAPDRAQIERLLDAAVRAPNHHLTQPWRFAVLRGAARNELGRAWAGGVARRGKDPQSVIEKPLRAPVIICVIERPKTHVSRVVELEEHFATGAAMQNILLAAHDMGLAAMLRTGDCAHLPEVREHLGVGENELIAAFIYVGYPAEDATRPLTRRADPAGLTEWRGW